MNIPELVYLHVLDNTEGIEGNEPLMRPTFTPANPFGKPGENYSKSYPHICYQYRLEKVVP